MLYMNQAIEIHVFELEVDAPLTLKQIRYIPLTVSCRASCHHVKCGLFLRRDLLPSSGCSDKPHFATHRSGPDSNIL